MIEEAQRELRAADAEAVRALHQRIVDGWNDGSGEAFAAPLADDADFIAFDGSHFKGRQDIARTHDSLFKTHLRGTRLVGDVMSVRFLSNDVALMHARGGTIMRGATRPAPKRDSIQTLVAARQSGLWLITAFHNTRIRPIGRNIAGTLLWVVGDWLWRLTGPRT